VDKIVGWRGPDASRVRPVCSFRQEESELTHSASWSSLATSSRTFGVIYLYSAAVLLLFCPALFGQTGRPSYIPMDDHAYDSINLLNLNVVVHAPIYRKAGAMPVSIDWSANSYCSGITGTWRCGNQSPTLTNFGAVAMNGFMGGNSNSGWATAYPLSITLGQCPDRTTSRSYSQWVVKEANGTLHPLSPTVYTTFGSSSSCINQGFTNQLTIDGSGLTVSAAPGLVQVAPIVTAGGVTINQAVPSATSMTDANGNVMSVTSTLYKDTLGMTAATATPSVTAPTSISWTDAKNGSPAVVINTASVKWQTNFGCTGTPSITEVPPGGLAAQFSGLSYPDGSSLSITYEPTNLKAGYVTGRIKTLTIPTGGLVTYTYGGLDCVHGSFDTLSRVTSDGTTSYSVTPAGTNGTPYGAVTTITDQGGNKTSYQFSSPSTYGNVVLTMRQVYKGSSTLLEQDNYCYNTDTAHCTASTSPYAVVTFPITQETVFTTPNGSSLMRKSAYTFDAYGNVLTDAEYDFGAGTPTKTTTIAYGTWNGSNCVAVSPTINNKPCTSVTTMGTNTVAQSRFTYNGYGNLTQTSVWNGSTWLSNPTKNVYFTNGTISDSYDVANNHTSYNYSGIGGCNGVFPTSVSSGGLTTYDTWDCTGGVHLTHTDANGNITKSQYEDNANNAEPFWRVSLVTDPLGNAAWKTYPSGASPDTGNNSFTFNAGNSSQNTTETTDQYGRIVNVQNAQSPSPTNYDTLSTSYGWSTNYRTVATSQLCSTTLGNSCTTVHTSYLDPLGRVDHSTTQLNETLTHTYLQNDDLVVLTPPPSGEYAKQTQTEVDGIGRIKSVCKIFHAGGGTTCTQASGSYSGVFDSYNYTAASGSTTVSVTRGSQTRSKTYDALGRVTSSTTPEGGTTTYTYDSYSPGTCGGWKNEPGHLMLTTNGIGVVCYVYDDGGLGRLTDVGIGGGANNYCKRFRYDSASNGAQVQPSGSTISNVAGRMVEAETDTCGISGGSYVVITDEWFSYDADGHMTDMWELTPHSTQYYHSTATFAGNGAITALQLASPSLYTINYGLDGEGRPNTLSQGSTSIVAGPTSTPMYNAAGQVVEVDLTGSGPDKDLFTYDANTGLMTQFKFQVGGANETGLLTWNQNHTLQKLAITDGFNPGGSQTCYFNPISASGTGYDDLNRLVGMDCGSGNWGQTFSYDQYDNLTQAVIPGHSGGTWSPGYNGSANNNHANGATYDASGNMTNDGGSNVYGWNADGKIAWTAASGTPTCGSSGKCTTYDAFGRMVEVSLGGAWAEFWYTQVQGSRITMSGITSSSAYWPSPGRGTFVASGTNTFLHQDWLGNARIVSSTAGHTVTADQAYAPYGEQYDTFGSTNPIYGMFASMTGDFDSGILFDTPNREFAQYQGRWLSPDPAGSGWNLYAYGTNPNSETDPTGLNISAGCFPPCDPLSGGATYSGGSGPFSGMSGDNWNENDYQGFSQQWVPVDADGGIESPATKAYFDSLDETQGDGDVTKERDDAEPETADSMLSGILSTFHPSGVSLAGCQGAGTPCYLVRTRTGQTPIFFRRGYYRVYGYYEYYVVDQYGVTVFGADTTEWLLGSSGEWTKGDSWINNPFADALSPTASITPSFKPESFQTLQEFFVQVDNTGPNYLINALFSLNMSISGTTFKQSSVYGGHAYNP
jgi:RHS repeat-associated protein